MNDEQNELMYIGLLMLAGLLVLAVSGCAEVEPKKEYDVRTTQESPYQVAQEKIKDCFALVDAHTADPSRKNAHYKGRWGADACDRYEQDQMEGLARRERQTQIQQQNAYNAASMAQYIWQQQQLRNAITGHHPLF